MYFAVLQRAMVYLQQQREAGVSTDQLHLQVRGLEGGCMVQGARMGWGWVGAVACHLKPHPLPSSWREGLVGVGVGGSPCRSGYRQQEEVDPAREFRNDEAAVVRLSPNVFTHRLSYRLSAATPHPNLAHPPPGIACSPLSNEPISFSRSAWLTGPLPQYCLLPPLFRETT